MLSHFNLSISCNKVLKAKEDIAAALSYFTDWQNWNRIDIQEQKGIIKTRQDFDDAFSNIILKEKVKDFLKCVYYLTDMMNYL